MEQGREQMGDESDIQNNETTRDNDAHPAIYTISPEEIEKGASAGGPLVEKFFARLAARVLSQEQSGGKPLAPQNFFENFVARMKHEGHDFDVILESLESDDTLMRQQLRFKRKDDGRELGDLITSYDKDKKILRIISMSGKERESVVDEWKPKGIGSALLAYMLTKYPAAEQIDSTLFLGSNNEIYYVGIRGELSPEDALKLTPAYKIRKKFGYSVIDLDMWENEEILSTRKTP
jgi:hypothetical protein